MKRCRTAAPLVLSVALLSLLITTACSGETEDADPSPARPTLTVGYTLDHPPLEYLDPDTGELTGFDVDLAEAVANHLAMKITWREMEFGLLPSSLARGEIDLAIAGIIDTGPRQASLTFVNYLEEDLHFFTTSDRGSKLNDVRDICGTTVVTVRGVVYPEAVDAWSKDNCRPRDKVGSLQYQEVSGALSLLDRGRADAAMLGGVLLSNAEDRSPGAYALIGQPIGTRTYGIAVDRQRDDLAVLVQSAVADLLEDGTYGELLSDYSLTPYGLDEITLNAGR